MKIEIRKPPIQIPLNCEFVGRSAEISRLCLWDLSGNAWRAACLWRGRDQRWRAATIQGSLTLETHGCLPRPSWRGSSHLSPGKSSMSPMFRNTTEGREPQRRGSNYHFRVGIQGPCLRGARLLLSTPRARSSPRLRVAWAWGKSAAWGLSSLLEQAHIVPTADWHTVWALHNRVECRAKFHSQGVLRSSGGSSF